MKACKRWVACTLLALGVAVPTARLALAQAAPPANPMRDMMRQMMRGSVPPPGLRPEALPESQSDGARLVSRYCTQCHDLPSPRYKTADQWPEVFGRMVSRMRMMSRGMMGGGMMGKVEAPSEEESHTLLTYLLGNAMRQASTTELGAGDSAGRAAFSTTCSQCHVLPSPRLHAPAEWPAVVARMQANIQSMDRRQPTPGELDAIMRFLTTASQGLHN